MTKTPLRSLIALGLVAALSACGGGDDDTASGSNNTGGTSGGTGSGSLTLTASAPSSNDTTLNLASAGTVDNLARAADSFSASPYCEVFWENVPGANGATYALQVYFRQSDKAVLHTSIIGTNGTAAGWSVFDNAGGSSAISNVTVDFAARTVGFAAKVLNGSGTETATVNGRAIFPANSGTPACGA